MVRRPSRRSGWPSLRYERGREAPLEFQEGLRGPPGGPGEIGMSSWRSGRGQDVLSVVWKAHPVVQEGSERLPGGPGGVRRPTRRPGWPSWRYGRGQEALPKVWVGLGGTS